MRIKVLNLDFFVYYRIYKKNNKRYKILTRNFWILIEDRNFKTKKYIYVQ